eukprot:3897684-Amphidinium_carterae.1
MSAQRVCAAASNEEVQRCSGKTVVKLRFRAVYCPRGGFRARHLGGMSRCKLRGRSWQQAQAPGWCGGD